MESFGCFLFFILGRLKTTACIIRVLFIKKPRAFNERNLLSTNYIGSDSLLQSPDGSTVASASADETIRFWKVFGPPPSPRKGDDESMFSLKRMHIR
jgi:hypothetical protein